MNFQNSLFVWLSGHSREIVAELAEHERIRIIALGMTLLLPVSIGATGAFVTVFHLTKNLIGATIAAAIVGSFSLVVDRALLANFSKNALSFVIRLLLTLITSAVFAHSVLLWLFSDKIAEIDAENRKNEIVNIASVLRPDHDSFASTFATRIEFTKEQTALVAAELGRKTDEIENTSTLLQDYRARYQNELNGRGPSGIPGEGINARKIQSEHIVPLEQKLRELENEKALLHLELSKLREDLRSTQGTDEKVAIAEKAAIQLTEDVLARKSAGVLSSYLILHEIISNDTAALCAYILLSLLLLFWELLPLLIKFSMPLGAYEKAIQRVQTRIDAELHARNQLIPEYSRLVASHKLKLEVMALDEIEANRWLQIADRRFEIVQQRRAEIPKRATAEQREAILEALNVLVKSLTHTGRQLLTRDESQFWPD